MKGFTKDGKFHPITDYKKGTRKSRDQKAKTQGVIRKHRRFDNLTRTESEALSDWLNKFFDKKGEQLSDREQMGLGHLADEGLLGYQPTDSEQLRLARKLLTFEKPKSKVLKTVFRKLGGELDPKGLIREEEWTEKQNKERWKEK